MTIRAKNALRLALILPVIFAGCQKPGRTSLVNFRHLEHLTERIELDGSQVSIVHIYANFPDYRWVDVKEAGPEGIACVDDAARAAVLYLRDFELNGRKESLQRARGLLDFVLAMQAPDGEFWNFIHGDHSVNREGRTSVKSFGWWAARGIWSLGAGCRIFRQNDRAYATTLANAVERSLPHVRALLQNYGKTERKGGYVTPTWLLYGSGADATSELVLGLTEYYRAAPAPELREMIVRLANGFREMQEGDLATFPYGLHRSWESLWHLWGNSQTQALAAAGRVLADSAMINSARREADGFYVRLLVEGLLREMDLANPDTRKEFDQIAYGIRPMAVGLLRLYDATGNADYLRLAGLAASWFFGNNAAGIAMYDSSTGRCFDGILSKSEVNRNSGAESTIEALMTLLELEPYPEALRYCRFIRERSDSLRADFVSPAGERIALCLDPAAKRFRFE
jgi:hypothetical protein